MIIKKITNWGDDYLELWNRMQQEAEMNWAKNGEGIKDVFPYSIVTSVYGVSKTEEEELLYPARPCAVGFEMEVCVFDTQESKDEFESKREVYDKNKVKLYKLNK